MPKSLTQHVAGRRVGRRPLSVIPVIFPNSRAPVCFVRKGLIALKPGPCSSWDMRREGFLAGINTFAFRAGVMALEGRAALLNSGVLEGRGVRRELAHRLGVHLEARRGQRRPGGFGGNVQ
jgi:hypothetical protein